MRRRRTFFFLAVILAVAVAAGAVWRYSVAAQPGAGPDPDHAAGMSLPLTQVILFNSGVGYFQREGAVEGATRVDLTFPVTDVNDLLKSLVLPDLGDGKVSTVSYDSEEPVDRTLKSFALDLTNNPTLGQILNQARGEKIEVVLQQANAAQPGTLTGQIVGMETQAVPGPKDTMVDVDMLNMLCAEGVREVPLTQVQRLRFLNPSLDGEFHRALEVLAAAHNSQKRTVSLNFAGDGKRTVKVGYVVENPIWKTSYRLVLDKKGKPALQGWAIVENTSDEDWKDVRMALISSRPISFQMDLYQPLFIPRPTVEPDLFASLRPPTYQGALNGQLGGGLQLGGGAELGGQVGQNFNPSRLVTGLSGPNIYQQNAGQLGQLGSPPMSQAMNNNDGNFQNSSVNPKLSYEEMQQRRQQLRQNKDNAKKIGSALALDPSGVASVANADEIGDYFQYTIDQKVTLPRQKSAMLPIVNQPVEGKRVSIYNEAVQAKFPLLGLRFKNTTGQDLMQGPVAVYEGGTYAGDGRIMDLQPNEERLLSFAIDQGVEIKAEGTMAPQKLISVKVVKGVMQVTHKLRETRCYVIKNRSPEDRDLIIEHPIREDWKLVTPEKANEVSRDVYRFDLAVAAGQTANQEVIEERSQLSAVTLASTDDNTIKIFLSGDVASPKLKEALNKAVDFRGQLAATQRDLAQLQTQLKAITDDQVRLRANLDKMPPTSAAYKRYLDKFDQQETEIEKIQKGIDEKQEAVKTQQTAYDDFLAGLSVE